MPTRREDGGCSCGATASDLVRASACSIPGCPLDRLAKPARAGTPTVPAAVKVRVVREALVELSRRMVARRGVSTFAKSVATVGEGLDVDEAVELWNLLR